MPRALSSSRDLALVHACPPARRLSAGEVGLVGWSALMGVVASLSASFVPGLWYARLDKPAWAPPAWLFAPLSMALYAGLALAAWMVWRDARERSGAGLALALFASGLVLDVMWSWLFFGLHRLELAALAAALLALIGSVTLLGFATRKPLAGWLVAPWVAWTLVLGLLSWETSSLG